MKNIKLFRNGFVDLCLNSSFCGSLGEKGRMKQEEKKRQSVLVEKGVDIRERWTEMYPKVFKEGLPKHVDWRYEKVVRLNYTRKEETEVIVEYHVVPVENLVFDNYCEGIEFYKRRKNVTDSCKEMILGK